MGIVTSDHPIDVLRRGAPYASQDALFDALRGVLAQVWAGLTLPGVSRPPKWPYTYLDAYLYYLASVAAGHNFIGYTDRNGTRHAVSRFSDAYAVFEADLAQEPEVWWYLRLVSLGRETCAAIDEFLTRCQNMLQGDVFLDVLWNPLILYSIPASGVHLTTHLPWLVERFGWSHEVALVDGQAVVRVTDSSIMNRIEGALKNRSIQATLKRCDQALAYDMFFDSLLGGLYGPENAFEFSFSTTKAMYTRNDIDYDSFDNGTETSSILNTLFSMRGPRPPLMFVNLIRK